MPRYEFYCDDCKKPFELILTLAEYEKGKIRCPKCGKEHVHQEAAAFFRDLEEKLTQLQRRAGSVRRAANSCVEKERTHGTERGT